MICKTCLMPDTRPRIVFTDGVCNACQWHEAKKHIDWEVRQSMFKKLLRKHSGSPYDCIVPFSGGKDSAAIAWRLKFEYGMRPLLVTYGQLLQTDVGRHNMEQVSRLGFDIFYWRVDQDVSRKLAKRFTIERGHPKQHYDAGVNSVPLITAKKFGINLVVYAEHGESEYGGLVLDEESRRRRNLAEVLENQVGDDPRNWATDGISERDIWPYCYPEDVDGIEAVYFSWYHHWDIAANALLTGSKMNFRKAGAGRSDGTFTDYDSIDDKIDDLDFYLMHIKFGFGRATRDANRLLQNGHITREQAIEKIRAYDGEFPETFLPDVLEYLRMTRTELLEVIEKHRNPNVWEQGGRGYELRNPI